MKLKQRAFFITGTDTGVGKTSVACALLHATRRLGFTAVGMKPVASGLDAAGCNEDVMRLLAASSVQPPLEVVNPYRYIPPIAPHIAAQESGQPIDFAVIRHAFAQLRAQVDIVWVEGVGGLLVPLNDRRDVANLAHALAIPLVLVVGMRLGCLNHALLTAGVIAARGLPLAGWVANRLDPDMARFEANLATLQTRLNAPLLGVIPCDATIEQTTTLLNINTLLQGDVSSF